jgi:hypothetical protein
VPEGAHRADFLPGLSFIRANSPLPTTVAVLRLKEV